MLIMMISLQDDLNADVRLTSERRLASLEVELAKASTSNLEKKMVTRYRGVKFFGEHHNLAISVSLALF